MSTNADFLAIPGLDRAGQVAWMQSLRPRATTIELLFHDSDVSHPLTLELAWLVPARQEGSVRVPGTRDRTRAPSCTVTATTVPSSISAAFLSTYQIRSGTR